MVYRLILRRTTPAKPTMPAPSSMRLPGSGTVELLLLSVKLYGICLAILIPSPGAGWLASLTPTNTAMSLP